MIVPQDQALTKALRRWHAANVRPDAKGRPALGHLHRLPDGRRAWANGFVIEVTDAPDPKLGINRRRPSYKGIDKKGEFSFADNLARIIAQSPKRYLLKPVGVKDVPNWRKSYTAVVFANKGGKRWYVDSQYAAYFHTRYPDARWYGSKPANPIRVMSEGEVVGVVMPLWPTNLD